MELELEVLLSICVINYHSLGDRGKKGRVKTARRGRAEDSVWRANLES
jgi:hypothetical protein